MGSCDGWDIAFKKPQESSNGGKVLLVYGLWRMEKCVVRFKTSMLGKRVCVELNGVPSY